MTAIRPPETLDELLERARELTGFRTGELAKKHGISHSHNALRTKGTPGAILEHALGANGGPCKIHDFPHLGVELKTIPINARGVPEESTYVCTLRLTDAESQEWEHSWVRAKLRCVLFIPLVNASQDRIAWTERAVGDPVLWIPTTEQESILRADFDDIVGLIGIGHIEELTAHRGRWLQVRPKAAHGNVRTLAYGSDGEPIETVPRGFYIRTKFTGAILRDPTATPA